MLKLFKRCKYLVFFGTPCSIKTFRKNFCSSNSKKSSYRPVNVVYVIMRFCRIWRVSRNLVSHISWKFSHKTEIPQNVGDRELVDYGKNKTNRPTPVFKIIQFLCHLSSLYQLHLYYWLQQRALMWCTVSASTCTTVTDSFLKRTRKSCTRR